MYDRCKEGDVKIMKKMTLTKFSTYLFLIAAAVLWLIPIFFIIFTSLKTNAELVESWFAFPKSPRWTNFVKAWTEGKLMMYMRNSFVLSIVKVPIGIFINAMAAFALTRMNFKWSNQVFIYFLVGMTLPVQSSLVPVKLIMLNLHLVDTLTSLGIVYLAIGSSFGIFILRGFMRTIPRELDEAAKIDGSSSTALFVKVIIPLCKPAIATLVIFDFLGTWNEFILSQVLITKNKLMTITTGLLHFKGEYVTDYTLLSAGVLISVIPVFTIFLIFQKYFVAGLVGSVKG